MQRELQDEKANPNAMLFASEQPDLKTRKIGRIARKLFKSGEYPREGSRGSETPLNETNFCAQVIEKEAADTKKTMLLSLQDGSSQEP